MLSDPKNNILYGGWWFTGLSSSTSDWLRDKVDERKLRRNNARFEQCKTKLRLKIDEKRVVLNIKDGLFFLQIKFLF